MNKLAADNQTVLSNRLKDLKFKNEYYSYLKSTSFLWNFFIFFIDLYVVSIYQIWLALDLNPFNMYIIIGLSLEFIYLVNLILIVAMRQKKNNMHYYFFSYIKFNNIQQGLSSLINLISLIPTHLLIILYLKQQGFSDNTQHSDFPKAVNLILITKLLRCLNIQEFLDKFEHLIKFLDFNKLTFFRIFVSLFHLLQITHFFACCFVFYNIYIYSGYFSVTPYDVSHDYMKYVVGLQWAVEAMIGSSFGDVYPPSEGEIFLTFISMVAGGVFYCKIFSDFSSLLQISKQFALELREKQKQAYLLANNKQVSQKIFDKIQYFYNNFEEGQKILMYYSIIKELPSQLRQEVALKFQQNLVQNVQIFNLGYSGFVVKMLKKMYLQVAVKDDFVLKMGESAQDFYILAKGQIQIINHDKKTVIRVLEPGAYFGEIGVLLTQYRSCYVKAQTDCIFMCIKKDHFLQILNKFPDIKYFLIRVAQQRMGTKNYEDVNQIMNISNSQDKKQAIEAFEIKNHQNSNHSFKKRRLQIVALQNKILNCEAFQNEKNNIQNDTQNYQQETLSNEEVVFMEESMSFDNENLKKKIQKVKQKKDLKVLILNEQVMICWAMVLLMALTYNLFDSLYSIFFSKDLTGDALIVLEALSFSIYFIDSLIFSRLSTFSKKNNQFILNNKQILFIYLNKEFFFDVLATVPFSNIYELVCGEQEFKSNILYIRLFRLLRLIKFRRFQQYIYILQNQYKTNFKYSALIKLAYIYFFLNHLNACIMYIICKYEYDRNLSYSLGIKMDDQSIKQERPFMIKNVYVNFLYWSFCVSTQGAYGDIWAMSSLEKTYQDVTNIFFKIFFCFLFANLVSITTVSKNMLEQYLEEVDSFKYWAKLIGLPSEIKSRVIKVYNFRWHNQKGMEDKELQESLLPDNIKDSILYNRMKFIVQLLNPLQSTQLAGIIILILKRFEKVIITQGEYIFQQGDLAQEVYFIEEGEVQIICNNSNNKQEVLAEIGQYGYFGGLEFINIVPTIRKVSVRAKTNLSVFILTLDQYSELLSQYPFAKQFIQNIYPINNKKKQRDIIEEQNNFCNNQGLQKLQEANNTVGKAFYVRDQNQSISKHNQFNEITIDNDKSSKIKIKLVKQEKQITLNQQFIYYSNNSNNQVRYYNDLIGSVIQTKIRSDKMYFQNQQIIDDNQNLKHYNLNIQLKKQILKPIDVNQNFIQIESDQNLKQIESIQSQQQINIDKHFYQDKCNKQKIQSDHTQNLQNKNHTLNFKFSTEEESDQIENSQKRCIQLKQKNSFLSQQRYKIQQQQQNKLWYQQDIQIEQNQKAGEFQIKKVASQIFQNEQKEEEIEKQKPTERRLSLIYFDDSSDFSNYQKQEKIKSSDVILHSNLNQSQNQFIIDSNSSLSSYSLNNIQKNFKLKNQLPHKNKITHNLKNTATSLEDFQGNRIHQQINHCGLANSSNGENQNLLLSSKNNNLIKQSQNSFFLPPRLNKIDSEQSNSNDNQKELSFEEIEMDYKKDYEKIQSYFDVNFELQVLEVGFSRQAALNNNILTDKEKIEILDMLDLMNIPQSKIDQVEINNKFNSQISFSNSQIQQEQMLQLQQQEQVNIELSQFISKANSNYQDLSTFNESYYQINELDKNVSYGQLSFDLEEPSNKTDKLKEDPTQKQNFSQKIVKISKIGKKFSLLVLNAYQMLTKIEYLVSFNQYYFIILIPVFLAFQEISFFNPILIVTEILVIINELRYLVKLIKLYKSTKANMLQLTDNNIKLEFQQASADIFQEKTYSLKILQKRQDKVCFMMLAEILLIIPFSMIFDLLQIEGTRTRGDLIIFQLIRVFPFCRLFNILSKLKKKNIYLCRVIETLILYFLLCHVLGCIFIVLGKIEQDFNASWLIKVPAPQPDFPQNIRIQLSISNRSLYLHAIYWAYVTTSHVGVGDVTGVNLREKIYSIFVMYFSTFTHIIFFGNLASMAREAAFMLKIKLDQIYEKIFQTVSLLNVTSFKIQVESYINFIWNDSYGLDENQLLEKLPFQLKIEILKKRYKNCINQSLLFKSNSWQVDMDIVHSILRFMKIKIYLTNDVIAEAGQSYQDLYIFLQGKYFAFQLNGKKAFEAQVGDFLGGSQTELPLTVYYQAKNICKVGIIDRKYIEYLSILFPDWHEKMICYQKKQYESHLLDLSYFQEQFESNQQQSQKRMILNNRNKIIDFHYNENLIDYYKQIATSFFEVEVANNEKENNNYLQSIQILNQINSSEENDDENQSDSIVQNINQTSTNPQYSQKEKEGIRDWRKRIEERNSSMVWDFQNISVHKSQNLSQDNILKNEQYHKPFIICLPYQAKPSNQSTETKDMIILHFCYIYKLAFIKDTEYNYFLHPYSSASYYVQLINLLFTIYSLIFTPIYVCYGLQISTLVLVFEIIHTVYLFVELFIDLRTPYFQQGLLVTNSRKILFHLWKKKNLKLRIACLMPLNIILWQISLDYQDISFLLKLALVFLRGIRLLQIFNLDGILLRIQTHNKSRQKALGMLIGLIHVLIMWHYFSSLWIWYVYNISVPNFPYSNWVLANNLQDANLINKILNGLFFVMSIATTCGYPTMKSNNDIEKIFFILAIYFGDAIIAYDFGLIAAQSLLLPEKYQEIDKKIKQFKILLNIGSDTNKNSIMKLHKKIQLSYLYKLYSNLFIEQQLEQIQPLIPQTLYNQLFHSYQAKYLQKIPILLELSKSVRFRCIQKYIELKVFLPYDFIVKKDQKTSFMFFVSKGSINVLSPKEDTVIYTLKEGDFFSQVSLNKYGKSYSCRIFTSMIAEIVQVKHKNIKQMFEIFPDFKNTIYKHARKQIIVPSSQNYIKLNLLSDYQQEAFLQIENLNQNNQIKMPNKFQNDNTIISFTHDYDLDEKQFLRNLINSQYRNSINQKQQLQVQKININEQIQISSSQHHQKQLNEDKQNQSFHQFLLQSINSESPGIHTNTMKNFKKNFLLEDDDGFLFNNVNQSQNREVQNIQHFHQNFTTVSKHLDHLIQNHGIQKRKHSKNFHLINVIQNDSQKEQINKLELHNQQNQHNILQDQQHRLNNQNRNLQYEDTHAIKRKFNDQFLKKNNVDETQNQKFINKKKRNFILVANKLKKCLRSKSIENPLDKSYNNFYNNRNKSLELFKKTHKSD
ncbi:hypothetical protein ABPG72_013369 [Tetrahymena utriculariae]